MADSGGTYVYGVIAAAGSKRPSTTGVEGERVKLVRGEGLAALVSRAPPGPVKASRRNLMAHTRVLQDAVAVRCVLPMQFGVVMPTPEAVKEELLDRHREELAAQLEALASAVELDVKVLSAEDALLRAIIAERADLREARSRLEGRSPEATYYERIDLGEKVAEAVAAKRNAISRHVIATLEPHALATEMEEPAHDQIAASAAFLVERERVPEFDRAVEELDGVLGPDLRVRYVGPVPPYHFADLGAEASAWA